MSVRSERMDGGMPNIEGMNMSDATLSYGIASDHVNATISAAQSADSALGEANCIATNHPDHPLRRTLVCNIRASLADLCLRKHKGTWAPTGEALRNMLQQKKFTSLDGTTEYVGDLKSVVLHNMTLASATSDFSIPIGIKVTGVDNTAFSLSGEAFSHVVPSNTSTSTARVMQADDVSLAYEFSRKFPGYTAENLTEKGIHEVQARKFCLVASDHPIVSAISENAEKLQMGEISMMPE